MVAEILSKDKEKLREISIIAGNCPSKSLFHFVLFYASGNLKRSYFFCLVRIIFG